ncbi:MAG: hypothetical protein V4691_08110, partial [Pseudomonadota bacterium]
MTMEFDIKHPDLPFQAWRKTGYSQFGEEGIIETLLQKMQIEKGYFVEFGAWDGKHFSNCAHLVEKGWAGCFIEGDKSRFDDLESMLAANDKVCAINAFIATKGRDRLDNLLKSCGAPKRPDVMSIDVDGIDFHIWKSLQDFE